MLFSGQDKFSDPDFERVLVTLFGSLASEATHVPDNRGDLVPAKDEFPFTSKLLPFVLKAFQDSYQVTRQISVFDHS